MASYMGAAGALSSEAAVLRASEIGISQEFRTIKNRCTGLENLKIIGK
jgi:hypothetical protein